MAGLTAQPRPEWYDRQRWNVADWLPEGEYEGVDITRVEVSENDAAWDYVRAVVNPHRGPRFVRPGTYTRLHIDDALVMSDTVDEARDHWAPVQQARWMASQPLRVLIHGLGIGMVTAQLTRLQHVRHIDVVELDPRVIHLVGPALRRLIRTEGGPDLRIHQGNALTFRWPVNTRWDIVWSDIWPSISIENRRDFETLRRRFNRRCEWHGCWAEHIVEREHRRHSRESVGWWTG